MDTHINYCKVHNCILSDTTVRYTNIALSTAMRVKRNKISFLKRRAWTINSANNSKFSCAIFPTSNGLMSRMLAAMVTSKRLSFAFLLARTRMMMVCDKWWVVPYATCTTLLPPHNKTNFCMQLCRYIKKKISDMCGVVWCKWWEIRVRRYRWCIAEMARMTRMWPGVAGQSQGPLHERTTNQPIHRPGHIRIPRASLVSYWSPATVFT